ncbi:MAG: amidohydrolase [Acidobacteriota bacterium]|nr:amidohydrolase [Acidobacteriota bacterium]
MPRIRALSRFLSAVATAAALAACDAGPTIDPGDVTIFTGPRFWTGEPEAPYVAGLLVSRGRIAAVLTDEEVRREAALGGTIVQLPGKVAVPGLVDAHAHLLGYGLAARRADLVGARTLEETLARVSAHAAAHPKDRWVLGRGWDQNDWPGKAWPDADRLEEAVPGRPSALTRVDGHALWLNRTALAAAGIGTGTPDPAGGAILRDAAGRPTGILIDAATSVVEDIVPPPDERQIEDALELAGRRLASLGLTGVHDMGMTGDVWRALQRLSEQGRFPLRVHAYAGAGTDLARQHLRTGPVETGRLKLTGIKLYADGALGSRGARLLAPYEDQHETHGLWVTPPDELRRLTAEAAKAGLQPAIHAIGDAANHAALDLLEELAAEDPALLQLRPRIEHVQILDPADLPRLAELGVVASMQPTHATSDMPWAEERLGPDRLAGAYAWRRVLDSGALLAFGSDFPVESADPRLGLYAAVTRQDAEGRPAGGWLPEERLTAREALDAFTIGAATAVGEEDEAGRIRVGSRCDLTVFAADPLKLSAERLREIEVAAVVVGGETVDLEPR